MSPNKHKSNNEKRVVSPSLLNLHDSTHRLCEIAYVRT